MEFESKYKSLSSQKYIWKYRLQNDCHIVQAPACWPALIWNNSWQTYVLRAPAFSSCETNNICCLLLFTLTPIRSYKHSSDRRHCRRTIARLKLDFYKEYVLITYILRRYQWWDSLYALICFIGRNMFNQIPHAIWREGPVCAAHVRWCHDKVILFAGRIMQIFALLCVVITKKLLNKQSVSQCFENSLRSSDVAFMNEESWLPFNMLLILCLHNFIIIIWQHFSNHFHHRWFRSMKSAWNKHFAHKQHRLSTCMWHLCITDIRADAIRIIIGDYCP